MITCSFSIVINNKGGYLQWHRSCGEATEMEAAIAETIKNHTRKAWLEMCSKHPETAEIIQASDVSEEMTESLKKKVAE